MNIKKLTLILFLFISTNLIAQNEIIFGIKAGGNFSGFHTGKSAGTDTFGISIGGMAEYELSSLFSLQAELLYNSRGGKFSGDGSNPNDFGFDAKLSYLDIPVQGKIYFVEKMSFDFGTQFGFLINDKGELYSGEEVDLVNTNTVDLSINGGFSYKFENNMVIQTRYNFGLTEVFENERFKTSMISLSLGYYFN
ncbi:porin family protein [Seonamhaeicola sp. ML3]|uniref:porin family protein n=1 Tax=Seonamhaeicola sp. ML3 TaxID=2937786 RepID=UPI00200C36BE|nr:porin family protein [Seonamhaeicola sp. ML3]